MAPGGVTDTNILNLFLIKDKNVVVTGCARGLGLDFAQALAQAGANIAAIDIADRPSDDFATLDKWGGKYVYYKADGGDYGGLRNVVDQIAQDFGSIDGW